MVRLLVLAPAPAAIACDPDPDGVAIALQIARLWTARELDGTTWRMEPGGLARLPSRRALTVRDRELLARLIAARLPPALAAIAGAMHESGEKGEQESLFWT